MTTIWKFEIEVRDRQLVQMPRNASILTAQFQENQLCLWALVDPEAVPEYRVIEIYGTGNPIPPVDYRDNERARKLYIATAQEPNRPLVWHVFEVK